MLRFAALVLLFTLCSGFCRAEEAPGIGRLLRDLVIANEFPGPVILDRIDRETQALHDEVVTSVTEHWKRVYLDPEYPLMIHGRDDAGALPVPDASLHAFAVLGYGLENGEMTEELKMRCDAAAAAAAAFPEAVLVCTGGATGSNNPERHTEAGMMKDYLIRVRGVSPERIFTDESALTTAENALNTFMILRDLKRTTLTVITSVYHQRWGQALYNAVGAQYRRDHGFSVTIIGNYCCDVEPSVDAFRQDDRYASYQLGQILGLDKKEMALIPGIWEDLRDEAPDAGAGR